MNLKESNQVGSDFEAFWDYKKNREYEKAENIRDFFKRVYHTLDDIICQYPQKNVLIVSHRGVSVPVYCYFNGIPDKDDLMEIGLHNCEVAKYSGKRK